MPENTNFSAAHIVIRIEFYTVNELSMLNSIYLDIPLNFYLQCEFYFPGLSFDL